MDDGRVASNWRLHADPVLPACVRTGDADWLASPEPGVERRMLERDGGEVARATSLVRYAPGSRFATHLHDLGEEFLVLEGVFSDEQGHHGAGTYVRNSPGSRHAPYSDGGCVIFVKLRQMRAEPPGPRVAIAPDQQRWVPLARGIEQALLHEDDHERVELLRIESGCTMPARYREHGEEVLLLDGHVSLGGLGTACALGRWDWWRRPGGWQPAVTAEASTWLWMKSGHLPRGNESPDGHGLPGARHE